MLALDVSTVGLAWRLVRFISIFILLIFLFLTIPLFSLGSQPVTHEALLTSTHVTR